MSFARVNHCWWLAILLLLVSCADVRGDQLMRKGIAEVNGTRLYYEVAGEGFPVVFISGGGLLDCRAWDDQFETFAKAYRTIRYDLRGLGKSAAPLNPFSHSHDLYSLLKFLGVRKAHLVGISFGGAIAIDFSLEHPEMVERLILAATGTSSDAKAKANLASLAGLAAMVKKDGLARAVDLIVSTPSFIGKGNLAAQEKIRAMYLDNHAIFETGFPLIRLWNPTAPPASDRLLEIRISTLVLIGENDSPDYRAITEKLAAGISKVKRMIIPGASHVINLDNPQAFNQAVLKFLGEK